MRDSGVPRWLLLTAVVACLVLAVAAALLALNALPQTEASVPASAGPQATVPSPSPTSARSPSPSTSRASNVDPPLPALLGSIGDSISVAFDVSATGFGPNPAHAWATGTAPNDGVFSIVERLRALGGDPAVADAAAAGARMDDAAAQATKIVRAAAGARPGKSATALVTIELGGNDACAGTPPAVFESEFRAAVAILRDGTDVAGKHVGGLPKGSRLLVLSVPNIVRLRELTAPVARAQEVYGQFGLCSAFLGPDLTPGQLAAGLARIEALNAALARVCGGIEASDGRSGRLYCRSDQQGAPSGSMFGSTFTLDDISPLDFFHPSLQGQAKIAAGAWAAGYWSAFPLLASDSPGGQP